ncbi:unnamed protein product, partial [Polarella glacialis]
SPGTSGDATTAAAAAAAAAVKAASGTSGTEATSGRCELVWSQSGHRLLSVVPGSSVVTLWAMSEGRGGCRSCLLPTGAAHSKLVCATFASVTGGVVATAGRRAEVDVITGMPGSSAPPLKAWPYVAAGICVWDTLCPPSSSLVAHDGAADATPAGMPAEYSCLAWAASQQRLLCGTKAGELRVFDLRQRRLAQRFQAHSDAVRHCFVLESSGQLLTLSVGAELKIWSLRSLELLETLPKLHSPAFGVGSVLGKSKALSCATLLSEQHLVTGGQDGMLVLTRL